MTLELILYLEPSKTSALFTQVTNFYNVSQSQAWSGNEALKYPVHTTMVGFFNDPTEHCTETQDRIINFLGQQIEQLGKSTTLATTPVTSTLVDGFVRPCQDSLLISIVPTPELLELISSLKQHFPELGLRLKNINHISLCCWDEYMTAQNEANLNQEQRQVLLSQRTQWVDQAFELAQLHIPMLQPEKNNNGLSDPRVSTSFDIALYSIQDRDKSSQKPYPLVELKRWTLS
ncbi:hypothetical protein BGZ76_008006 [Entomortierella beljakovae]|nr:hypothetical protein BGZ76_008006 [Entomortierella beljakovae]